MKKPEINPNDEARKRKCIGESIRDSLFDIVSDFGI